MATNVTWNGTSYSVPDAGELNWSALSAFLVDLGQNAQTTNKQIMGMRVATASPVTVSASTDSVVVSNLTVAGAVAVDLPAGVDGQIFTIIDGKGDAGTNNVTITPNGGQTINGAATYVIDSNYGGVVLGFNGTEWNILAVSTMVGGSIPRSEIAAGTADHVVINDGSGNLSSEANLAISRGGTGAGTATAGFDGLSPTTTRGDLVTRDATNNVRLGVGGADTILKSDGTDPSWGNVVDANVDASANINATKLGTGVVDNTEFNKLNTAGTNAAGELVTTDGAQDISGKDIDGGTASDDNRITIPKNTKTNLDGLTRKEATLVYATDQSKLFVDDGAALQEIGSGGGGGSFNYVTNPDAEVDASTGVTVANFTSVTRGTTAATMSDSYFILSTGNSGLTCTVDWALDTLNEKHDGSLMRFSMRVNSPSTVDTYKIGIHDGSAYVAGTELTLTNGANQHWEALFVLDRATTYTVRLERTSGTTDETLYIDDIIVSPEQVVQGNPGTEWVNFTPDWTTHSSFSTNEGKWRRIGDSMQIQVFGRSNALGSGTALLVVIPESLTMDTSKVSGNPGGDITVIGSGGWYDASGTDFITMQPLASSSTTIALAVQNAGNYDALDASDIDNGDELSFTCTVPIAEWSGTTTFGANSRVEYAYNTSTSTTASDTTSFGYGSGGAQIQSITAFLRRRVRFQTPIQPNDRIEVQISDDGLKWFPIDQWFEDSGKTHTVQPFTFQNSLSYGMGRYAIVNDTDVDISFGQYRSAVSVAYGAAGQAWSSGSAGNNYWRVVKSSNPVGIGAGLATSDQPGAVGPRSVQTELTVTGTGWTTTRAVGLAYSDDGSNWRLKFNIRGTVSSSSRASYTATISGVTFKNVSNFFQAITGWGNDAAGSVNAAIANPNASTISVTHATATTTSYNFSGDVELDSKPTWA